MPMNDAVNASHGEFIDASEELEALRNVYVLTGMVLERDIRTIAKGAHKLRKAAALLDVFAHSLATVRVERDDAQLELTRMTDAYDLKMRVHDALNRDYVALRKRAAEAEAQQAVLMAGHGVGGYEPPKPEPDHRDYTIAVDFDGCLCTNAWPGIGAPNTELIESLNRRRETGDKLILWTCREGALLDVALEWCRAHGLEFDAANENLPELIERYGGDCRKISADEYWDDKAVNVRA